MESLSPNPVLVPFPHAHAALLWAWLNEFPGMNFDDSGPADVHALTQDLKKRHFSGENIWEALHCPDCQEPVGAVGYMQITRDLGRFHGICFTKGVHGTKIPLEAVKKVLDLAFREETKEVWAYHFAQNERIRRFLRKLGAIETVVIDNAGTQRGKPVHCARAVITRESFFQVRAHDGYRFDPVHCRPSKGLPVFAR